MKAAKLTINNAKGEPIGEMEIDEIANDVSEIALRKNYDHHIKLFMRHLGFGAHIGKIEWLSA